MAQQFPFLFPAATILLISAAIGAAGQVNVENITPKLISTNEVIRNSGAKTIPNWFRIQKHHLGPLYAYKILFCYPIPQLGSGLSREHCEQIAEENGAFTSLIGTGRNSISSSSSLIETGRSSSSSSSLAGTDLISISKDGLVSLIGTGANDVISINHSGYSTRDLLSS
ncbi:hypothetical protein BVRB_6g147930 [Beta vulgaris subsp. vulgaris]|nr:hypothetical protein BVRB_6g147930 [Beta vulgaris subsp. vulgaris]